MRTTTGPTSQIVRWFACDGVGKEPCQFQAFEGHLVNGRCYYHLYLYDHRVLHHHCLGLPRSPEGKIHWNKFPVLSCPPTPPHPRPELFSGPAAPGKRGTCAATALLKHRAQKNKHFRDPGTQLATSFILNFQITESLIWTKSPGT